VAGLAALREAKQRGEHIDEPVVTVLTSTGLKDVPATPIAGAAADRASLDRVIASLKEELRDSPPAAAPDRSTR
jgi:hypothetical protein